MSQNRLAGCKRHRNWKGGWSGKETKEIEIAEKSELVEVNIRAEQEIYQGRGAMDPQLGKQHPVRSIRILEFRTWKGLPGRAFGNQVAGFLETKRNWSARR